MKMKAAAKRSRRAKASPWVIRGLFFFGSRTSGVDILRMIERALRSGVGRQLRRGESASSAGAEHGPSSFALRASAFAKAAADKLAGKPTGAPAGGTDGYGWVRRGTEKRGWSRAQSGRAGWQVGQTTLKRYCRAKPHCQRLASRGGAVASADRVQAGQLRNGGQRLRSQAMLSLTRRANVALGRRRLHRNRRYGTRMFGRSARVRGFSARPCFP